jgi:hypothetical protein
MTYLKKLQETAIQISCHFTELNHHLSNRIYKSLEQVINYINDLIQTTFLNFHIYYLPIRSNIQLQRKCISITI